MGPSSGLFDWIATGAQRALSYISWGKKPQGSPAIPPTLVAEAMERASSDVAGPETIKRLCEHASDPKSSMQDRLQITDILTKQVGYRVINWRDKEKIRESLNQIATSLVEETFADPTIWKNYGLRLEVATMLAKQNPREMCAKIASFDLTEEDRFAIAKICAQTFANTPLSIKNFGLSDPAQRIEVAKLCAKRSGYYTTRCLANFEIDSNNQKALIDIATLCAENGNVAEHIKSFGIQDPQVRFRIAKISAEADGEQTAEFIANFELEDPAMVKEVALICAQQNGGRTARYIKNFKFDKQEDLVEVAIRSAQSKRGGIAQHIQEFGIIDPASLKEIATLGTKHDPWETAEYFANFGFKEESVRVELAELLAKSGGPIAKFIKNYEIHDKAILLRIAKISAQVNGSLTAEYIDNFGIDDLKELKELAYITAMHDGGAAENIKAFKITDQEELVKLARICAAKGPNILVRFIQDFGIQDQKVLVELAEMCAKNQGGETADDIKNFGIQNPADLLRIAKLCAQSGYIAEYIANFGITDPGLLFEILLLSAKSTCINTITHYKNFGITDQSQFRTLLATSLVYSRVQQIPEYIEEGAAKYILKHLPDESTLEDPEKWPLLYFAKALPDLSNDDMKKRFGELFQGKYANELADIMKQEMPKEAMIQFIGAYFYMKEVLNANDAWLQENGILRMLVNMERDDLRNRLQLVLFQVVSRGAPAPVITESGPKSDWKTLAGVLYTNLEAQGVDKEVLDKIRQASEKNKSFEIYNYHDPLLDMLLTVSDWNGSSQNKTAILAKLLPNPLLLDIQSITSVFLFKEPERLLKEKALQLVLEELLIEKLALQDIDGFTEKYAKTFNKSRLPAAIPIYAAKLSTLYSPESAMQALKLFITQVLNGTFEKERYNVASSAHLQKVAEKHGEILKKWQNSLSDRVAPAEASTQQESPKDWLQGALPLVSLTDIFTSNYIERYLKGDVSAKSDLEADIKKPELRLQQGVLNTLRFQLALMENAESAAKAPNERGAMLARLMDAYKSNYIQRYLEGDASAKSDLEADIKKPELRVKQGVFSPLRFQLTLMEYADSAGKRPNEVVAILERLKKSVENQNQPAFLKAIQDQIENEKKRPTDELMVYDSDEYMDLILCGYEVYGSCQAINGDPDKNRGLLGYLLNGWNRVIKVSSGKNDPMVARCKLQILWDGEQPVLLREAFYSKGPIKKEHKDAINALAKKKAHALGIPLVAQDGEGEPYGKPLYALGGPSPFEYSDAAGGGSVRDNGIYSVKEMRRL